jgi:hypothetical protein
MTNKRTGKGYGKGKCNNSTAKADPCGMTNKRTGKGYGKGKCGDFPTARITILTMRL